MQFAHLHDDILFDKNSINLFSFIVRKGDDGDIT